MKQRTLGGVIGLAMAVAYSGWGCGRHDGPGDLEAWDPYTYVPYPADRLIPPGCVPGSYRYPYAYGCRCSNERDCPPGWGCRCCKEAEWVCVCAEGEGTWYIWCCGHAPNREEPGCNGT